MPLLNIPAYSFTRRKKLRKRKKEDGLRPISHISGASSRPSSTVIDDPTNINDASAQKKRLINDLPPERPIFGSYGSEKTLKITFRLTEKVEKNETPGSVYFKDDEKRFSQQHTLKLKTLFEYDVKMEVEPAQEISSVVLGGRKHEKLKIIKSDEEAKSVYKFVWSTNKIKITYRKYRTVLPCVINFEPYKELIFDMQVKFYDNEEIAHYTAGEPLQFLDFDCQVGTGIDNSTNLRPPIRFN